MATARKRVIHQYRAEIDGTVVWEGEGDTYKVIPAEFRDRPADTPDGEPHPPAVHLYESGELIGVQISLAEEDDQMVDELPAAIEQARQVGDAVRVEQLERNLSGVHARRLARPVQP